MKKTKVTDNHSEINCNCVTPPTTNCECVDCDCAAYAGAECGCVQSTQIDCDCMNKYADLGKEHKKMK